MGSLVANNIPALVSYIPLQTTSAFWDYIPPANPLRIKRITAPVSTLIGGDWDLGERDSLRDQLRCCTEPSESSTHAQCCHRTPFNRNSGQRMCVIWYVGICWWIFTGNSYCNENEIGFCFIMPYTFYQRNAILASRSPTFSRIWVYFSERISMSMHKRVELHIKGR